MVGLPPMTDPISSLRAHLGEIEDIRHAAGVLEWDQQTMMPPHGAPARAEALATVTRIAHEMFVSGTTGSLLEQAESAAQACDHDSDQAALVRLTRRSYDKARLVPG